MTPTLRFSLLLLLATPLAADPLADVRAALARFPAREPLRATYELQHNFTSEGKFDNEKLAGRVTVEIEGGESGMRIIYPRALLEQLERERLAEARNPKQKASTVRALREIDPVETTTALDFAPALVRLLDGAKLVSDVNGTWQGKPARVMVVRVSDRLDPEDAGRVKIAENRLTLWLGSDLVPLAAEHVFSARFSFLLIKGETKEKKSWHLARAGDHLVRARFESTSNSSGMGQKGSESVVATVRVH